MDRLRTPTSGAVEVNSMKYHLNNAKHQTEDNKDGPTRRHALVFRNGNSMHRGASRNEEGEEEEGEDAALLSEDARAHNLHQWLDQRDLHEEYLYHQAIINRSAQNWELIIIVCAILCIAYFAVALSVFVLYQNAVAFAIGIFLMLVLLFVILRVSVLNAELASIVGTLKSAASADWAIYGSRKALIEDFEVNPIAFKLYGIEITYAYLITLGTAFFTANLSVIMVVYSSSLSGLRQVSP